MGGIDTRYMLRAAGENNGVTIVLQEGMGVEEKPPYVVRVHAAKISEDVVAFLRVVLNLHTQGKIEIDPDLLEDLQRLNSGDVMPDQENLLPPSAAVDISRKTKTNRPEHDGGASAAA